MSMTNKNINEFFFVNDNIFNKEKINLEENFNKNNSFSTNETLENAILSDEEIDFNQDFFPKNKTIKFTDFLVDNWEFKIKQIYEKINQQLLKIKKI